jgi:FkbM family methyltransferase
MPDYKFLFEKYVLKKHQSSEAAVIKTMKRMRGDVFVDIGSNKGFYSKLMQNCFNHIISIDPIAYPEFNPTYRLALSDYESNEEFFYVNSGNGSADTLLEEFHYKPNSNVSDPRTFKTNRTIKVRVTRFDSLISYKTDLAKIDVEGAEIPVLRGMTGNLPQHIIVELHNVEQESELLGWFDRYDYSVKQLDAHPHFLAVQH